MKFADAIQIITNVVDVEPSSKFSSQLKNYQKLGIWPEIRTGKGYAADYSLHTVFQICVFLTLIEAAMLPASVGALVRQHDLWGKVDQAVRDGGPVEVFAGALAPYGGSEPYVHPVRSGWEPTGVVIWPASIAEGVAAYTKLWGISDDRRQ